MEDKDVDALMAPISDALVKHFMTAADVNDPQKIRHASQKFALAYARVRLALSAERFDEEFVELAARMESGIAEPMSKWASDYIRENLIKQVK
ncbi:hypothetical protein [Pseudomonas typographi]|uniref:hypothetical protein n=1 Tax=Pseudomonas typographi TaxID=2715964 RepID=UPI0016868562|nr:hypothetical protein [Pseudomonas typographi]MBD1589792.1 hypothetical protein [Pseudomonas typographi]